MESSVVNIGSYIFYIYTHTPPGEEILVLLWVLLSPERSLFQSQKQQPLLSSAILLKNK